MTQLCCIVDAQRQANMLDLSTCLGPSDADILESYTYLDILSVVERAARGLNHWCRMPQENTARRSS